MEFAGPHLPPSTELSRTGVAHLRRFWAKLAAKRAGVVAQDAFAEEWATDHAMLNALGVGLEPTIQFVYRETADFDAFERWIDAASGGAKPGDVRRFNEAVLGASRPVPRPVGAAVLSAEDRRHFDEHGYVVVPEAVTDAESRAAEDAVWEFLGYDRADPASWYGEHPARLGIMVQLFHHPALEAARRSERIRRAYAELFGHERLFVTTDRVGFNPPEAGRWRFPGPRLHWDVSLAPPIPFALQGLLHLTDTRADQGAFTLVPGFHRTIGAWLEGLPAGTDPRRAILEVPGATPIAAKRGDFVIWHQALPHGASPNTSAAPRLVQYVNWQEIDQRHQAAWR